ncbi:MAG: SPOR domain-containing protein [Bacteroidaceae bacterium]|nr:SPOR domain-containing protein [Bacteroidaceae bacterium]
MIELSTHIEYLLLSQSWVSVPQLGTFTRRDMSSRRIDEEGIFLPPYRTASFQWNSMEAGEDFILSLSKLHGLSRHEARIVCMEYVDELQQTLSEEGTVAIGSMGYLLRDADSGEIRFMPLQSGIASPAYYGLDAVPFAKLSHDVRQQRDKKQARRKTKVTSFQTDSDVITIRINRRLFNYVSTVAASVVLFFAFTSPFGNPVMPNEQQKAVSAITAPISPRPATTLEEKAPSISQTSSISPIKVEEKVASDSPVKVEEKVSSNSQAPSNSPYAIVLASAISKKSALSFADKLQQQGINALACEFGGMVRVIIPGFATQDDAYAEIRRLKSESKDLEHAWPCLLKEEVTPLAL